MFNIVEQINIKMGGTNFFIDFRGENILKKNKVYLILGLECKQSKGELIYTLTSTTNPNLNKTYLIYINMDILFLILTLKNSYKNY